MNISSIRNKFSALCEIFKKAPIDILNSTFPEAQFKTDGNNFPILGKTC